MKSVPRLLNATLPVAKPLLFLFLLVAATQYVEFNGWLAPIDGNIYNRILRHGGEAKRDADIYVVEIDDDARAECFGNGYILDPAAVLNLVRALTSAHPRVIGVDILTDNVTTAKYYRGRSPTLPKDVPIIWASGVADGPPPEGPKFWRWLFGASENFVLKPQSVLGFAPDELEDRGIKWAVPVYSGDPDVTIRRFPRTVALSSDPAHSVVSIEEPTWPRMVAEQYCGSLPCTSEDADELYIAYGGEHKPKEIPMREILTCSGAPAANWGKFTKKAKNNLVLVGGSFSKSGDFHRTSLGSHTAGILVNAYAVRAELQGAGFKEVPQPLALLLDLAVGIIIILVFEKILPRLQKQIHFPADSTKGKIAAGILIGAAVILGSRVYANGKYLLGFAGFVGGILIHELQDLFEHRQHEEKQHAGQARH